MTTLRRAFIIILITGLFSSLGYLKAQSNEGVEKREELAIILPKSSSVFWLENPNVKSYLYEIDYSADDEYVYSYITNYQESEVKDLSHPLPVRLQWNNNKTYASQRIEISDNQSFTNAFNYNLDAETSCYDIYNLIPSMIYYWRVIGVDVSGIENIVKTGKLYTRGTCRMLYIPGDYVGNFRDLGGWNCGDGKRIKYNKLIRGAEVLRVDGGPYIQISEDGIRELRDRIGCTVELDFGDIWYDSPLEGNGFEVYRDHSIYGFYGYDRKDRGLATKVGRECLHNCLELVIQKLSEGKTIYFHCNAGADRTGTFAFLLESLCGVNDSDKSKDFELTSLWSTYYKKYGRYTGYCTRKRNEGSENTYGYKTMISYINQNFNGETLNDKVYDLCTKSINDGGLDISDEKINILRSLLIENYVTITATSYTREYGDANPVFEYTSEGAVLDGVPEITCEATETSPVDTYDIVVKQGTVKNYNVTYVGGTLTVTKAPLTVKAGEYTMKQGDALPEFVVSYEGWKNNETEAVLTKLPTLTTTATSESEPGTYDVLISGAEAQNYDISYTKGTLTITEGCKPGIRVHFRGCCS